MLSVEYLLRISVKISSVKYMKKWCQNSCKFWCYCWYKMITGDTFIEAKYFRSWTAVFENTEIEQSRTDVNIIVKVILL